MADNAMLKKKIDELAERTWDIPAIEARYHKMAAEGIPKKTLHRDALLANQPQILAIRMTPRNIYASRGSNLEVIGINERHALTALLSIRITSTSGETVFSKDIRTEWNKGVSKLLSQRIDTRALRGGYTVTVTVSAEDGTIVTENESTIDVFNEQELKLPKTRIAVLDLDGPFSRFLE